MSPRNWSSRQSPTDLDEAPPEKLPVLDFDVSRSREPGKPTWPEKVEGQKWGPAMINRAIAAGRYVVAEVEGFPRPVVVYGAKWAGPVLEVRVAEGLAIPERLYTLKSLQGFKL